MRRPREPGARLVHPLAPVRGLAERAVPHRAQRAARAALSQRGGRILACRARAARVGPAACPRGSTGAAHDSKGELQGCHGHVKLLAPSFLFML